MAAFVYIIQFAIRVTRSGRGQRWQALSDISLPCFLCLIRGVSPICSLGLEIPHNFNLRHLVRVSEEGRKPQQWPLKCGGGGEISALYLDRPSSPPSAVTEFALSGDRFGEQSC